MIAEVKPVKLVPKAPAFFDSRLGIHIHSWNLTIKLDAKRLIPGLLSHYVVVN